MLKHSGILVLALILMLGACGQAIPGSALQGSGKYATRDYAIDGFTEINACCGFQVTVTGGDTFKVSVTTDDNVFDAIVARKEGSTLRIGFDTLKHPSVSTTRLEAAVTMPDLQTVTVDGGAQLRLGQPAPKGTTLRVNGNGGAQADLRSMPVQKARVELGGGAQATINVTASLDYALSGGAQLHYTGNPTIGTASTSGGASVSGF
ncbi:MAG: GIN domain-containing protein [Rudaea sp.]